MVFFQGHPEYEAGTLLREYRRDIGRFLRREREAHPLVPDGYFDALSLDQLTAFRDRAIADRREELIADFPSEKVEQSLMAPWRQAAVQVYHNWLISIVNEFLAHAGPNYRRWQTARHDQRKKKDRIAAVPPKPYKVFLDQ